jgi:serine/threonine protein kinase
MVMDVSQLDLFSLVRCPGCAAEVRVRSRLGSFQLTELLARGGTGSVYRAVPLSGRLWARNPGLLGGIGLSWRRHREVALKVVARGEASQGDEIDLLRNEERLVKGMRSDRVVRILAYEEDAEGARMAMELMKGGSLHDMITAARMLDEKRLITTALDVIGALDAIARSGMVHGDLKPANILFEESGRAKLSDFGLTRRLRRDDTPSLGLHATPDYVAPEVLDGSRGDFRSDLYGLGGCLHFGLTGRPPHATDGLGLEELRKVKRRVAKIPPLRTDVSPDTINVVNRMLETDPARRFRTPREAREALQGAWDSMPESRRGQA